MQVHYNNLQGIFYIILFILSSLYMIIEFCFILYCIHAYITFIFIFYIMLFLPHKKYICYKFGKYRKP